MLDESREKKKKKKNYICPAQRADEMGGELPIRRNLYDVN
jgi:hypothetical protein